MLSFVCAPAWAGSVDRDPIGPNGFGSTQPAMLNEADGVLAEDGGKSGGNFQGVNTDSIMWLPQPAGLTSSGVPSGFFASIVTSVNGSAGRSTKSVETWPVTGSGLATPLSLIQSPSTIGKARNSR